MAAARAEVQLTEAQARFDALYARELRAKRVRSLVFSVLFAIALGFSWVVSEFDLGRFARGIPDLFGYVGRTLPVVRPQSVVADLAEWYWGFWRWLGLLFDTILIGFMATLLGGGAAFLMCFPASRNLAPNRLVYVLCRRLLEFARAVPELVYAMIFVFAFGLGPLPGVLAIAVHATGALGKLFSEVNENVDLRSVEAVRATGANWAQCMRYAVLPQVLPNYLSYGLLRFEINVRSAAIIGFVGAGGIGQELYFVIRQFIYSDVSAIILMIIVTVALIDITCENLRMRLIGESYVR